MHLAKADNYLVGQAQRVRQLVDARVAELHNQPCRAVIARNQIHG